jgi:outer membrane lipoprotein-sorting protein
MQKQLSNLKTYKSRIEYLFIQDPDMLDSRILQKGMLYYAKEKQGSIIRIDFNMRKQDDGDEEKHIEQFIFDGVWLTRIDYQLEKVDHFQQAEPDKPIEVFEFISHNFPMVGFTKTEHLRKQFEITVVPEKQNKPGNLFHLHLKVKKDSIYKQDYREIDFWLDKKSYLPRKMVAVSTNDDIYDINLRDTRINKNLKKGRFKVDTPKHFGINRKPLESK